MRTMIAGTLLLAAVAGQAAAQNRPFTQGPVVAVSYVRVKPGMFDKYMEWVATDWKRSMEAQKKEGIILDYGVYSSIQRDEKDWNMLLSVTYKNMAALDNLRDRTEPVAARALERTPEQMTQANIERGAIRDPVGGRLLRQLILK
jgi:hypothetical protein